MADHPSAFVTGYPIRHSRSPLIHGYWLRQFGLDGSYRAVEVAPDAFAAFISTLHDNGFVGGNVTAGLFAGTTIPGAVTVTTGGASK